MVLALRAFRHHLLGGGAPRPAGCLSDFDLRTDNQAITWLKTKRHLNKMYVPWLDEIEDFRFDVTHLPGSRNPTDPLSRRGFEDGDGPAQSTGDPDPENRRVAAVAFAGVQEGDEIPSPRPSGGRKPPMY